jgi:hypothetical protein
MRLTALGFCLTFPLAASCGPGTDAVSRGRASSAARRCALCHQGPGDADGLFAGQVTPSPGTLAYGSNLTADVETGLGGWADVAIVRALRNGVDAAQVPLCAPMPRFASDHYPAADSETPMSDLEAYDIVAFLRSLPPVRRQVPASECPPLKPLAPLDMTATPPPDLAATDGGALD